MSTLVIDTIQGRASANSINVRGEGSANTNLQQGLTKVWINFNGSSFGTADSFNVTSITDNGTGDYYVTIASDMVNANYCTTTAGRISGGISCNDAAENTSGRIAIGALDSGGSRDDPDTVCAAVDGDLA